VATNVPPFGRKNAGRFEPPQHGREAGLLHPKSLPDPLLTEPRRCDFTGGQVSLTVHVEDHALRQAKGLRRR
jgi:hypothetical protein